MPVDWSDVRFDHLVLLQVSKGLRSQGCKDLCPLRFLLAGRYGASRIENLTTPLELVDELFRDDIHGTSLVPELLDAIGRYDILRKQLGMDKSTVTERLEKMSCDERAITPYWKFLHDLCLQLKSEQLKDLRFLCHEIPPGVQVHCGHVLFTELYTRGCILEGNLSYLRTKLSEARLKALSKRVAAFGQPETSSEIADDGDVSDLVEDLRGLTVQSEVRTASGHGDISPCGARPICAVPPAVGIRRTGSGKYDIKSDPRGICLILGLETLTSSIGKGMKNDCDLMEKTFISLNFTVDKHYAVDSGALSGKLDEYSSKNKHDNYDCFVVCFIGHGRKDEVSTSDGICHDIHEIMEKFGGLRCPSLNGKPKLFFVNTCQGAKDMRNAGPTRLDAPSGRPEMGDFLLSQATFPGYSAYMSTSGSDYIRILCEILKNNSQSKHLLQIMGELNDRLGKASFVIPGVKGKVAQCTPYTSTLGGKEVWFN